MEWNFKNTDNIISRLLAKLRQTPSDNNAISSSTHNIHKTISSDVLLKDRASEMRITNIQPDDLYWCCQKLDDVLENIDIYRSNLSKAAAESEQGKQLVSYAKELQLYRNEMMYVYKNVRYLEFQIKAMECELKQRLHLLRDLTEEEKYCQVILIETERNLKNIKKQEIEIKFKHRKLSFSHATMTSTGSNVSTVSTASSAFDVSPTVIPPPPPTPPPRNLLATALAPLHSINERIDNRFRIVPLRPPIAAIADAVTTTRIPQPSSSTRKSTKKRNRDLAGAFTPPPKKTLSQGIVLFLHPVTSKKITPCDTPLTESRSRTSISSTIFNQDVD